MPNKDCIFCSDPEVKQRKIVGNDLVWAFPAQQAIVPGHVLISPVRHVDRFRNLSSQEKESIFDLQIQIEDALKRVFGVEDFNVAYNQGESAGQSVPHFHLHVLPRKVGDTGITQYEPRQFLYRPGSRAATTEEELQVVAKIIRDAL